MILDCASQEVLSSLMALSQVTQDSCHSIFGVFSCEPGGFWCRKLDMAASHFYVRLVADGTTPRRLEDSAGAVPNGLCLSFLTASLKLARMRDAQELKVAKWPFLLGDAFLLGLAYY